MIKVVKFGGSSLASAEQFKKVGRHHPAGGIKEICNSISTGETHIKRYESNRYVI